MDSIQTILEKLDASITTRNVAIIKEYAESIVNECGNITIGKEQPMKHAETISNLQTFKKKIY